MQACAHPVPASTMPPGEAARLKARGDLLAAVVGQVQSWDMTQSTAAARLGVTRPRLNDLLRGKAENFSLDALVRLAASAGLTVQIVAHDESQA